MTSDQSLRERSDPAADPLRTASQARSPAGPGDAGDGGDPACWACLVCEECRAVVSEGHRAGCSHSSQPAAHYGQAREQPAFQAASRRLSRTRGRGIR